MVSALRRRPTLPGAERGQPIPAVGARRLGRGKGLMDACVGSHLGVSGLSADEPDRRNLTGEEISTDETGLAECAMTKRTMRLALHDESVDAGAPQPPVTIAMEGTSIRVSYLPAWTNSPHLDGWICRPRPTADGRVAIALTLAGELLEQDRDGALIQDGRSSGERILAWGVLGTMREGELQVGRRAALLVGNCHDDGWSVRIGITAALLWVFGHPTKPAGTPAVAEWIGAAYGLVIRVPAA